MNSHTVVDGQFVSNKVEQVVLAIQDYEPLIEVQWIPEGARTPGQSAYKIVYHDPNGPDFTLFHVGKDEDFDERVLMRIIANDQRHSTVTLSDLEAFEAAQAYVGKQKYLDEMEEAADIAAHILKTRLNTYRVNKDLIIRDNKAF